MSELKAQEKWDVKRSIESAGLDLEFLDDKQLRVEAQRLRSVIADLQAQLARANDERQKFIGLFSDYEFSCEDFETAAKIWAQMRALQVKTKDELDHANETADAKTAAAIAEIAQFVQENTPYLQGVGSVGITMANHIREKYQDASRALAEQIRGKEAGKKND